MNQHGQNAAREALESHSRRRMLQGTAKSAFGALLLPVVGSSLLAACGGGTGASAAFSPKADVQIALTPRLMSVDNFRDVAGASDSLAYRTTSGQKLKRGRFYRSNVLTPSAADLATLNTVGIQTVYDLRTPDEVAKAPDTLPAGAKSVALSIFGNNMPAPQPFKSPQDAIDNMESIERQFVTDPVMSANFGQLFKDMANGFDAQLFHCTSGKDRTGWTAAILLTLAGVPREIIMQDYLLTNVYSAASIEADYNAMVNAMGKTFADNYYPMLGVQESFLNAGFDQVAATYGSMDNYISNGMGLDFVTQAKLKAKLLA